MGVLALSVTALGCGSGAEWSPKYPKQPDYPQVVGVVHAGGDLVSHHSPAWRPIMAGRTT